MSERRYITGRDLSHDAGLGHAAPAIRRVSFGARDYIPSQGKWAQRDPIGQAAGDNNIYEFVLGNPVALTDPSGLSPAGPEDALLDRWTSGGRGLGAGINPWSASPQGKQTARDLQDPNQLADFSQAVIEGVAAVDPTPVADGLNAAISAARGKTMEAAASAAAAAAPGLLEALGKGLSGIFKRLFAAADDIPIKSTALAAEAADDVPKAAAKAADDAAGVAPKAGKLVFDPATKSWTSPGGLVYGQGSAQGNRVKHVFDHLVPNPNKGTHSIFNVDRTNLIGVLDEGAAKRGAGVLQPNGNRLFEIDMGRVIGTNGESRIRMILKDGTNDVITAFPIQ